MQGTDSHCDKLWPEAASHTHLVVCTLEESLKIFILHKMIFSLFLMKFYIVSVQF